MKKFLLRSLTDNGSRVSPKGLSNLTQTWKWYIGSCYSTPYLEALMISGVSEWAFSGLHLGRKWEYNIE